MKVHRGNYKYVSIRIKFIGRGQYRNAKHGPRVWPAIGSPDLFDGLTVPRNKTPIPCIGR